MIHILAFNAAFMCCLAYTFMRGGGPEKTAMLLQACALIITIGAIHFLPRSANFTGLAQALAACDIALLLALIALALRANRLWTIVLAGLQLSTVLVHVSKALIPALPAASYGIFAQLWAWPMLLTTAAGTYAHSFRMKKFDKEADWKPFWPDPVQTTSTI